ncbi:MAG: hypothetical protein IJY14_03650 [Acholeplasmatales bacterium]|nr:hypothetical protein [Acholeplasmatales bacterium]
MISINMIGILILLFIGLPKLVLLFFPPKKLNKRKKYHQLEMIEMISGLGLYLFGSINLFGYGYHIKNEILQIIWLILFIIGLIYYYGVYLKFLFFKRDIKILYDKMIFYCPQAIAKSFLFIVSGILLLNPYVIIFSIPYAISTIMLDYKRFRE